jgi:hypothetical protein
MTVPFWFLVAISALEVGLWAAFIWHRQWVDVIYWTGVLIINAALLTRAYGISS